MLILTGLGIIAIGYMHPTLIGLGARPYAYVSVMAIGAMFGLFGALLWSDG